MSLCSVPEGARSGRRAPRTATSLEMLRHMVAAGEGYALMPCLATRETSALSGLVRLRPLDTARAGRTIGLVWRDTDPRGPDFEQLATLLRRNAPQEMRAVPGQMP